MLKDRRGKIRGVFIRRRVYIKKHKTVFISWDYEPSIGDTVKTLYYDPPEIPKYLCGEIGKIVGSGREKLMIKFYSDMKIRYIKPSNLILYQAGDE